MKIRKFLSSFGGRATALAAMAALSAAPALAAAPLEIAVTPGPMDAIIQHAADLAAKQGLPVQVIVFSDWTTPNAAAADGDVDANFYEHKPFLAVANKARHFGLIPIASGVIMPVGLFSHKYKTLAALPSGATVAIANDPINRGRGLQLCQKAGLITLKPGVGDFATTADITANPKNLKFVELEAPQLVRALDDVDVSQVSFTFLLASGGDPNTALITDGAKNPHYAIQVVTRPAEANDPRLLKFISIFHSSDEKSFILSQYHGFFTPTW